MKIRIHKNYFKKYFLMDWDDVPEFLSFQTIPSNFISVEFETEEERKERKKK